MLYILLVFWICRYILKSVGLMACNKHTDTTQRSQNKVLGNIVNDSWYCINIDIHPDLVIDAVATEIKRKAQKQQARLH